jgi:hypothetical protein
MIYRQMQLVVSTGVENGSKLKAYCTGRGEVEVTELLYKNESGMELHSFLEKL